jgi:hypothetical protein
MKRKSGIVLSAAVASVFAIANASYGDPSLTLNLVYVGSTTTVTASPSNAYSSITTGTDPNTADQSKTNQKLVFDVYADYHDNGSAMPFSYARFDVLIGGTGLVPMSSNGSTASGDKKYFGSSITYVYYDADADANVTLGVLSTNEDGGSAAGDLQWISAIDATVGTAYTSNFGTSAENQTLTGGSLYVSGKGTKIGRFGLGFTGGALTSDATVTLAETTGNNFLWFTDAAGGQAASTNGISSNTYTIHAQSSIPEPASLGVLALGGLALLARRRK